MTPSRIYTEFMRMSKATIDQYFRSIKDGVATFSLHPKFYDLKIWITSFIYQIWVVLTSILRALVKKTKNDKFALNLENF